jgi:hypothetical protein
MANYKNIRELYKRPQDKAVQKLSQNNDYTVNQNH